MSLAMLDPRPGPAPDLARIAALSAAISLNAVMLLLALRPLAARHLLRPEHTPVPVRLIAAKPLPPAPPVPPMPPLPHPRATPATRPVRTPLPVPSVHPTPMSRPAPLHPVTTPAPVTPVARPVMPTGPVHAQLAYLRAPPPRYPMAARRAGMQGTVTLHVLVDARGRPQQVVVVRGSGYPRLDRAARRKVLADWRFVPARVDGRRVPAWALVPVVFQLRQP